MAFRVTRFVAVGGILPLQLACGTTARDFAGAGGDASAAIEDSGSQREGAAATGDGSLGAAGGPDSAFYEGGLDAKGHEDDGAAQYVDGGGSVSDSAASADASFDDASDARADVAAAVDGSGGGDAASDAGGGCAIGTHSCRGNVLLDCRAGQWVDNMACPSATPVCANGQCVAGGASCQGLAATCGDGTQNCCTSSLVTGGTFYRSYDAVTNTDQTNPATVSVFRLDQFEVTVGRFRKFVQGYPGTLPANGAGKNPKHPTDTGWTSAWASSMPQDQASLLSAIKCDSTYQSWTDSPGANESLPMNCISWYEAYAFCIWDGGWLPTEAEWNYAAAGGSEQRVYPWSSPPTSTTIGSGYASYKGADGVLTVVGSKPAGNGKWNQADMAGNVNEWTRDSYDTYPNPCADCLDSTSSTRVWRGGSFLEGASIAETAFRGESGSTSHYPDIGVRCSRAP